jgi:hypothetical protein
MPDESNASNAFNAAQFSRSTVVVCQTCGEPTGPDDVRMVPVSQVSAAA